MKKWAGLLLLLTSLHCPAQDDTSYTNLLGSIREMPLTDSLLIDATSWEPQVLDSTLVKKFFSRVLPITSTSRLKKRTYSLAGKFTTNENFDILVLVEDRRRVDSTEVQTVFLVTTRKNGSYIASIEAAVSGTRRKSGFDISSWLFSDYSIIKDSRITVNDRSYDEMARFKINNSGRFILYPNY